MTQDGAQTSRSEPDAAHAEVTPADWFITSSFAADIRLDGEREKILADTAEAYLRAGGRLSWHEWLALSDASRSAFLTAGDRIRAGEIAVMAEAIAEAVNLIAEARVRKALSEP